MSVAIVGATGAVGREIIKILETRKFPLTNLKLLASRNSSGKELWFKKQNIQVEELTESSFHGVDIALFSASGSISQKYAPIAVTSGATVIDNSSAFRMDPDVPLIVPEVNPNHLAMFKKRNMLLKANRPLIRIRLRKEWILVEVVAI